MNKCWLVLVKDEHQWLIRIKDVRLPQVAFKQNALLSQKTYN